MITSISHLPEDTIKLIIVSLPVRDILQIENSNWYFHKLCQEENLWHIIGEQKYIEYLIIFPHFTWENKWRQLVLYLSRRRFIPVYDEEEITGYIVISPDSTIEQFHTFLCGMSRVFVNGDQMATGISLHQLEKSIDLKNSSQAVALLSTPEGQIAIHPEIWKSVTSYEQTRRIFFLDAHHKFLDNNIPTYFPTKSVIDISLDERKLWEINLMELFDIKGPHGGALKYNLFNSLKRIHVVWKSPVYYCP